MWKVACLLLVALATYASAQTQGQVPVVPPQQQGVFPPQGQPPVLPPGQGILDAFQKFGQAGANFAGAYFDLLRSPFRAFAGAARGFQGQGGFPGQGLFPGQGRK